MFRVEADSVFNGEPSPSSLSPTVTQEGAKERDAQGVDCVEVLSTFILGVKAMTLGHPLLGFVETAFEFLLLEVVVDVAVVVVVVLLATVEVTAAVVVVAADELAFGELSSSESEMVITSGTFRGKFCL